MFQVVNSGIQCVCSVPLGKALFTLPFFPARPSLGTVTSVHVFVASKEGLTRWNSTDREAVSELNFLQSTRFAWVSLTRILADGWTETETTLSLASLGSYSDFICLEVSVKISVTIYSLFLHWMHKLLWKQAPCEEDSTFWAEYVHHIRDQCSQVEQEVLPMRKTLPVSFRIYLYNCLVCKQRHVTGGIKFFLTA